jgi:hypothetical protein
VDRVNTPGVVQDAFGQSGFAAVYMGENADVSNVIDVCRHCTFSKPIKQSGTPLRELRAEVKEILQKIVPIAGNLFSAEEMW